MEKIVANDIRSGNILVFNNDLWVVSKTPEHTKPGKGGAYVQVEMKNLKTGTKLNERFSSSDYVEKAFLERKKFNYLYDDGDYLVVMDPVNFEQIMLPRSLLGEKVAFVSENMEIDIGMFQGNPINVSLPATVASEIVETEPVIRGATATATYKPAILSNGVRVMVPQYIESGQKILVKTEDCTFVERVK